MTRPVVGYRQMDAETRRAYDRESQRRRRTRLAGVGLTTRGTPPATRGINYPLDRHRVEPFFVGLYGTGARCQTCYRRVRPITGGRWWRHA